jgi:hypothetical protein
MSQDHFLSKVYESVANKTATPSNKPQNLKQAYYRVILEQIDEDTDVLMQNRDENDNPTGDVEEFKISDQLAKQIKSSIKKETGFAASEGKTNLNEIIQKVLTIAGWSKTSRLNYLIESISNIFDKEDLAVNNIIKYPNLLESLKSSLFEENLINKPFTRVELKSLIPQWFHDFFESKDGANVINGLWNLVPNTKPASGSGELAFSLISNAKKASEGDLSLNGDLIEIKGSSGTMGADGQVLNTASELAKILQGDLVGVSKANRKKELINRLNEISPRYEQFKNNVIQQVENDIPFEEIKKTIDAGPLTDKSKERLYKMLVASMTIPEYNFRDSLLAFFSKYEILSDDQLAEGVFAARNYVNVSSPESIKNKIKEILISDKNSLFKKGHERYFTPEMASLISALHLCCYQEKQKFKGIIFANDVNKSMVYFKFDGDSVAQNLSNAYSFILKFKPTISLSMSQMQSAAGFSFFKI